MRALGSAGSSEGFKDSAQSTVLFSHFGDNLRRKKKWKQVFGFFDDGLTAKECCIRGLQVVFAFACDGILGTQ